VLGGADQRDLWLRLARVRPRHDDTVDASRQVRNAGVDAGGRLTDRARQRRLGVLKTLPAAFRLRPAHEDEAMRGRANDHTGTPRHYPHDRLCRDYRPDLVVYLNH
jgi:hypothetical protein